MQRLSDHTVGGTQGNTQPPKYSTSESYQELPDFDTMVAMHRENPEELEELRQNLTRDLINQAPENSRHRLEGLQFQIDMELRRARTPMARCVKMSGMMHDSLLELNDALHSFQRPDGSDSERRPESAEGDEARPQASVLNFDHRRKRSSSD